MSSTRWLAAALLLGSLGCGREIPTQTESETLRPAPRESSAQLDQARLERLARRMAIALNHPGFRNHFRASLGQSRFREHKLQLQQFLRINDRKALRTVAAETSESEETIEEDLNAAGELEIYLPVEEHRSRWAGDPNILVATAVRDGDTPIAFDTRGERYELDRQTPPDVPVISLVPSETDFTREPSVNPATCTPETCGISDGEGGGTGGGSVPAPRGIYLTKTSIYDLHEDWLRGSPEVEAMFMGPLTDTTKMSLIACSNESSAFPRYYDQDKTGWSGHVLIADSTQLERVRRAYPPGTPWSLVRFTVAFWEDDTGRCQIATDVNTWKNKLLASGLAVLGGTVVLTTDWTSPIDAEAWPFVVQLPLGLLGLLGTIGGNDDFIGLLVNRTVWNPVHPDDVVYSTQVLLDGGIRNGHATIVWE